MIKNKFEQPPEPENKKQEMTDGEVGDKGEMKKIIEEEDYEPLSPEEKAKRKEIYKGLVSNLHEVLKQAGFKKKASTWRRELDNVIQVVNLQRSQYSFSYFLNLGVFIKKLDETNLAPQEYECHYRKRIESIAAKDRTSQEERVKLRQLFDFEDTSVKPEEKIKDIKKMLQEEGLKFFLEFDDTWKQSKKI